MLLRVLNKIRLSNKLGFRLLEMRIYYCVNPREQVKMFDKKSVI
jgi:hypothetical protein